MDDSSVCPFSCLILTLYLARHYRPIETKCFGVQSLILYIAVCSCYLYCHHHPIYIFSNNLIVRKNKYIFDQSDHLKNTIFFDQSDRLKYIYFSTYQIAAVDGCSLLARHRDPQIYTNTDLPTSLN